MTAPTPAPPPGGVSPLPAVALACVAAVALCVASFGVGRAFRPRPDPPAPPAVTVAIPQPLQVVLGGATPPAGPQPTPAPQADDGDPQVRAAAFAYFNFFVKNYYDVRDGVRGGKSEASELAVYGAIHDQQKHYLAGVINTRRAAGASLDAIANAVYAARRGVP